MKNIQVKTNKFQNFYGSRFMTLLLFAAAVEIYTLVMIFLGGAR